MAQTLRSRKRESTVRPTKVVEKKAEEEGQRAVAYISRLSLKDWKAFWNRHPDVRKRYEKWAQEESAGERKADYVRGLGQLLQHSPHDSVPILSALLDDEKASSETLPAETKERKSFVIPRTALMALLKELYNEEVYAAIKATDPSTEQLLSRIREVKENFPLNAIIETSTVVAPEFSVVAYGITQPSPIGKLVRMTISRRQLSPNDVRIQIIYSGVCHSDLHHVRNDWKDSLYPMVPGHEIVGRVTQVGPEVKEFKTGDVVGIGNMLDSCGTCPSCQHGHEQYCMNGGPTWTYNSHERFRAEGSTAYRTLYPIGAPTYGGYSTGIVCHKSFVFPLPKRLDPATAAPLFCAGITLFAPLREQKIGKHKVVGVAGIGGLGHLGIMIAKALGATVIALTTSKSKIEDAKNLFGADDVVYTPDPVDRQRYKNKIDLLLSTIPGPHNPTPYLEMVKPDEGKLHILGDMEQFPGLFGRHFAFPGKQMTSSNVGGVAITQEMLAFCEKHNISPVVQHIAIETINEAFKNLEDKKPRYRYVIDWSRSK